ncbi:MAG: M23 family metallopeptidase [Deltaproteobacteria bacterium]|nr:M23 family metallopeptidase [Deltaproteobacteria bacterium]
MTNPVKNTKSNKEVPSSRDLRRTPRGKSWIGKGVIAFGLLLGAGGGWMLANSNAPMAKKAPSTAFRPLPADASAEELAKSLDAATKDAIAATPKTDDASENATKVAAEGESEKSISSENKPSSDAAVSSNTTAESSAAAAKSALVVVKAPTLPSLQKRSISDRVLPGETLSVALTRHGVSMDDVNLLVASLKGTFDVRTIRPGDSYTVEQVRFLNSEKNLVTQAKTSKKSLAMDIFKFRPSVMAGVPTLYVAAKAEDGKSYSVDKQVAVVDVKLASVSGVVNSSLYVAMTKRGEGPTLVNRFVDVFGWDVDFYRETQRGDTYKVVVEKKYAEGRFVGYGKVLAAEYVNNGHRYRGFWFESKDEKVQGLFTQDGNAMEKTFLKNPMEIARMTSNYGQRFHPVLRRLKAHNGVDYGASRGTPYWAVADGTVVKAKYSRSAGNMIVLRHANGYETQYFHSQSFAKGIRVGVKVKQRQVIGYVGTTGRSTGPHLHFGMKKAGRYVNPAKQRFPAAKPVPNKYNAEYKAAIAELLAEIEAMENS